MTKYIISILIVSLLFVTGCQVSVESVIDKNIDRLKLENPFMRKLGVAALGGTGDERAIIPIALLLSDKDEGVLSQVYEELNHLRQQNLPVDEKIILKVDSARDDWAKKAVHYLIKMHVQGVDIEAPFLDTLPKVENGLECYRELLVYLYTRPNSTLRAKLLAMLPSCNGAVAASALLELDKCGYTPDSALIDELVAQGVELSEATGQLLVQYACRESYLSTYIPEEQLQVHINNSKIVVLDNSFNSEVRCEKGDTIWKKLRADLGWVGRLALLANQQETPTSVKELYKEFLEADKVAVIKRIANEMESFKRESQLYNELVSCLVNENIVKGWIREQLEPDKMLAVMTVVNEESSNNNNKLDSNGILVIDSESSDIYDTYHWWIPKSYRPVSSSDIRYVLSIPKQSGLLSLIDSYNGEVLLEKEVYESDNRYHILAEIIYLLEKEE